MSGSAKSGGLASHPLIAALPPETTERLKIYEALLRQWQRVMNLVAPSTLDQIWVRHFADSVQVSDAAPAARRWLDLGSGAGFPGLVTAIRHAGDPRTEVHLVESDRRKCAFMQGVSRETGAPAIIHCGRIEAVVPGLPPVEAISARALAPLPRLIGYVENLIENGATAVFSKGQQGEAELTDSPLAPRFCVKVLQSRTADSGKLLVITRRASVE